MENKNNIQIMLSRLEYSSQESPTRSAFAWDLVEALKKEGYRVQILRQPGRVSVKVSRDGLSGEGSSLLMTEALVRATQRALLSA